MSGAALNLPTISTLIEFFKSRLWLIYGFFICRIRSSDIRFRLNTRIAVNSEWKRKISITGYNSSKLAENTYRY